MGVGRCKAGVETCDGLAWSACAGAVIPAADEDCATPDDDDCDGRSDDCAETTVAFAIAFTNDRKLRLEDWGGGLGIVDDPLFWVVEPGGRVVDVFESGRVELYPSLEFEQLEEGEMSTDIGGAWPGALQRSYETAGTRAGHMIAQERWDGSRFAGVENSDEYLQWSHDMPIPWRDGHAIALQQWYPSYEMMEALAPTTLEYGGIEAAEQRRLQRKVDRLLARAKPRLVIVAAEEVEPWEDAWLLFAEDGEEDEAEAEEAEAVPPPEATVKEAPTIEKAPTDDETAKEAPTEDGAQANAPTEGGTKPDVPTGAVAEPKAPALPKPPALPEVARSFVALSDGTVVMFASNQLWTWKPRQRSWTPLELPSAAEHSGVRLRAGLDGELLLSECLADGSRGLLWRHDGSSWSAVPLPTPACLQAITMTPDRARWLVSGNQLWQR